MEHAAQMCPFLRNVSLSSSSPHSAPLSHSLGDLCPASAALPGKNPIFEETSSSFEVAFRLFHGETGVVPLAKTSDVASVNSGEINDGQISQSLSVIPALHATGITAEKKSLQSISTAKDTTQAFSLMGYETAEEQDQDVCPYAAAFAGGLGASAATISLSVFGPSGPFSYDSFRSRGESSKEQQRRKEQEEKRRREEEASKWIIAVHASVPLVAVLRKAALMPKYAMAFTIAASVIGQAIGARLERRRLKKIKEGSENAKVADTISGGSIATTSSSITNSSSSFKSAAIPRLPQRSVMLSKTRSECRAVAAGTGSCKAAAGKEGVGALVSSVAVGAGGGASAGSALKVAAVAH
ncbi:unnamed protein product [Closterium sp. NIES-64]|nr:unnamed protein product [Closterium sp. NIES-64]CAI5989300.1 unnamed protein product [Closterium sp. NIES-64]